MVDEQGRVMGSKSYKPVGLRGRLEVAEALCKRHCARLTPLRRDVLELVLRHAQPVSAYALLDELKSRGHNGAPPTVYRALAFLQAQGLVHRIATSNTFVACNHPGDVHQALIFVCTECGDALETQAAPISASVGRTARRHGFRLPDQPIEVAGTCRRCLGEGAWALGVRCWSAHGAWGCTATGTRYSRAWT